MTLPVLVLVHGGAHAADCWDPTVDEVHRRAPDLPVLAELFETLQTGDCFPCTEQVLGYGLPIADPVIDISEAPAVNFGDFEIAAEVHQATVERDDVDIVPSAFQMRDDFFGARGVACTLTVHAVENVGHRFWA